MKKKLLLQDLAELLATNEEIGKKEADTFVRAFFDIIEQGLLEDKFVKIKGLGTFKLVTVSERESVNINTGERFQINGHTKVTFTPDASMKELVNRPFAHFEAVDLNEDIDLAELEEFDTSTETDDADESQEVEAATDTDDADERQEVEAATDTDDADESQEVEAATDTDEADESQEVEAATDTDNADESQEVEAATETDNADESQEVEAATDTDNADESQEVEAATDTDNVDESQEVEAATDTEDADESQEVEAATDTEDADERQEVETATDTDDADERQEVEAATDTDEADENQDSAFENNQVSTTESDNIDILSETTQQPLNTGRSIEDYQQENPAEVSSSTDMEENTEVIASKPMPINATEENDSETTTPTDSDESPNGVQVTTTVSVDTENDTKDELADNHTENLNTHLQLQDSPQQLSDSDNIEDDIVVTSPQHLTTNSITSNATPTTTNSIKYEYTEVPMPRKRNWWKISLISLCVLLIMCCCYFAGYFRLLCPPCQFTILEGVFIPANVQHSHSSANKPEQSTNSDASNTALHHNPTLAAPATTHDPNVQAGTETTGTEQKKSSGTPNKMAAEPSAKDSTNTDNNKPDKHVVRPGDTLLNISRRYYGNEAYVKAIMELNHLKDSNNIKVGLVLKLP